MRALVLGGAGAVCKETTRDLAQYSDYDEIVVADFNLHAATDLVEDILHRLELNEYKRRQAPPGLKITTKAFGYGRRYPIARRIRSF